MIKEMHDGGVITIRQSPAGKNSEFPIQQHALVMGELTRYIEDDVPWHMLFVNDIVLVDETARGVNTKLEIQKEALESKKFSMSRKNTEYME